MTAAPASFDAAVVGAGPVGLAAALLLDQAGYRVASIGPATSPAERRTAALLSGSVALLERLGVWSPALAANPLRTMRIVDGTQRLFRASEVAFDAGEIGLPAFGYNVANVAIVAALEAAIEQRSVARFVTVVDAVDLTPADVRLTLADGPVVHARLAIAADGRKSRLREAAGIAADEWRYDQAALVVNLRHTQPHDDTSTEFHTEAGPFTLVPLGERRSSLVWVDRPAESERRRALADADLAAEIESRSASILGAITIDGPRQVFPLSGMTARAFAASRVMLAGEAAHVFPPIGAQGLNLGYRDVVALGDVLSGPVADPGAGSRLDAYDRARRPDVLSRTFAVDAMNRSLLTSFLPVQMARSFGIGLIDRIPLLRREAMRQGLAAAR